MALNTRIKFLHFVQRGAKTYFMVGQMADGSGGYSLDDMVQKYNLNLLDSEIDNKVIVEGDGQVRIITKMTVDADQLLSDLKLAYPNEFTSTTVLADPLAASTTTTTTTSTTTTSTSTTTTTTSTSTTTTTTTSTTTETTTAGG